VQQAEGQWLISAVVTTTKHQIIIVFPKTSKTDEKILKQAVQDIFSIRQYKVIDA